MKKMNDLIALQNKLFEAIDYLQDRDIKGDELTSEINRSLAINEMAKTIVANGALMLKCANDLYSLPIHDDVPLIPMATAPQEKKLKIVNARTNIG